MVNFEENYHSSSFQRMSNIFQGGGGGGGVQLHIPHRNPYMIFKGGPDPLPPPLDPHLIAITYLTVWPGFIFPLIITRHWLFAAMHKAL